MMNSVEHKVAIYLIDYNPQVVADSYPRYSLQLLPIERHARRVRRVRKNDATSR